MQNTTQKLIALFRSTSRPFAYAYRALRYHYHGGTTLRQVVELEYASMLSCLRMAETGEAEGQLVPLPHKRGMLSWDDMRMGEALQATGLPFIPEPR